MGDEEEHIIEKIHVNIEKKVLIQTLLVGFLSFMITGFLVYYLAFHEIILGLSMIFGSTIGFLGLYFILISQPLFKTTVKTCKFEDDEELEFQSTMKV
jgi:hypothetical protein